MKKTKKITKKAVKKVTKKAKSGLSAAKKPSVLIQTVPSMAPGSSESYLTVNGRFNARSIDGTTARVHISKAVIRDRANYVALDLPISEMLEVLKAI